MLKITDKSAGIPRRMSEIPVGAAFYARIRHSVWEKTPASPDVPVRLCVKSGLFRINTLDNDMLEFRESISDKDFYWIYDYRPVNIEIVVTEAK